MASTVRNASFIFRREKGLDCQNCVGLRAWTNLKFNCVGTAIKSRPQHLFVVRESESHNGAAPLKKLGLSGAECEAAIVAGNVPDAPPVPPKPEGPAGTPEVYWILESTRGISALLLVTSTSYAGIIILYRPLHRHLRLTGGHSTSSSFSDPYSSDGYDGIVREEGVIRNDETVHQLSKQAVAQAGAGADVGSPRDMMNGLVEANS